MSDSWSFRGFLGPPPPDSEDKESPSEDPSSPGLGTGFPPVMTWDNRSSAETGPTLDLALPFPLSQELVLIELISAMKRLKD
jgi:hypothetical protein